MSTNLRTLVLVLFVFVGFVPLVSAWDDCPRGLVNDTYPGACSRYIDTNKDGICDHSQPNPITGAAAKSTVSSVQSSTATVIPAGTVPASTQKTPLAPLPLILVMVGAVMFLLRKTQQMK
jgi:hypothetical protein